jgi:hypothetical protein
LTIHTENPKAKPSKALSRDKDRPALQLGRVIERDGKLVLEATDSYKAVRVPLGTNGEEPPKVDLLPAPAVKVLDAPGGELDFDDGIVAHGPQGETVHYEEHEANFPDLAKLWPADPKRPYRIGFRVSLLKEIADALGGDEVEMVVDISREEGESGQGYTRAIYVRGLSGGEAVLMPLRLNR